MYKVLYRDPKTYGLLGISRAILGASNTRRAVQGLNFLRARGAGIAGMGRAQGFAGWGKGLSFAASRLSVPSWGVVKKNVTRTWNALPKKTQLGVKIGGVGAAGYGLGSYLNRRRQRY